MTDNDNPKNQAGKQSKTAQNESGFKAHKVPPTQKKQAKTKQSVDASTKLKSPAKETDKLVEEQSPRKNRNAPKTKSKSSGGSPSKKGGLFIALLALLIAVAAVAFAAWTWQTTQQQLEQIDGKVAAQVERTTQQPLADVDQRVHTIEQSRAQLEEQSKVLGQDFERVKAVAQSAVEQVTDLSNDLQGGVRYWQVKQLEQLLTEANRRLQLYGQVEQAQAALQMASQLARDLNDPRLLDIRQEIIDEIAQLSALPDTDIEQIVLTISALIRQVPSLPPGIEMAAIYHADEDAESVPADENSSHWQRLKTSVQVALENVVTVQHVGTKAKPALLPPDAAYYLSQNLILELRAAKLAALNGQANVYKDSLQTAQSWLDKYYDQDNAVVAGLINQLEILEDAELAATTPDISQSLINVRQFLKNFTPEAAPDQHDSQPQQDDE